LVSSRNGLRSCSNKDLDSPFKRSRSTNENRSWENQVDGNFGVRSNLPTWESLQFDIHSGFGMGSGRSTARSNSVEISSPDVVSYQAVESQKQTPDSSSDLPANTAATAHPAFQRGSTVDSPVVSTNSSPQRPDSSCRSVGVLSQLVVSGYRDTLGGAVVSEKTVGSYDAIADPEKRSWWLQSLLTKKKQLCVSDNKKIIRLSQAAGFEVVDRMARTRVDRTQVVDRAVGNTEVQADFVDGVGVDEREGSGRDGRKVHQQTLTRDNDMSCRRTNFQFGGKATQAQALGIPKTKRSDRTVNGVTVPKPGFAQSLSTTTSQSLVPSTRVNPVAAGGDTECGVDPHSVAIQHENPRRWPTIPSLSFLLSGGSRTGSGAGSGPASPGGSQGASGGGRTMYSSIFEYPESLCGFAAGRPG
jgi:hypothetical protein